MRGERQQSKAMLRISKPIDIKSRLESLFFTMLRPICVCFNEADLWVEVVDSKVLEHLKCSKQKCCQTMMKVMWRRGKVLKSNEVGVLNNPSEMENYSQQSAL